ncbi:MAG: hypothetical protein QNJ09_15245 [Paracoccaceae bacterium]|nr:hypothetical protein [Paracoccaceae bacterium]
MKTDAPFRDPARRPYASDNAPNVPKRGEKAGRTSRGRSLALRLRKVFALKGTPARSNIPLSAQSRQDQSKTTLPL